MWPVSSPPIVRGALLISETGRIVGVGPDDRVPQPEGIHSIVLPDTAVAPGLINAHTHLELTAFRDRVSEGDFFAWIQHIRRAKRALSVDAFVEAAGEGLRECWRLGVTTVADTGDTGATAAALGRMGGRGIAYQEVFGPHPDQAEHAMVNLIASVDRLARDVPDSVTIGVSPHAPYTVSGALFERVAAFASSEGLPVAVHIAESPAEMEFVTRGGGPFAASWRSRGIPIPESSHSAVAFLGRHGVLSSNLLCIHAVQTDERDLAALRDAGSAIALCPRSNRRHGHGASPVAACVSAGLRCGLGTDSVASVPSTDMFAEVREAMAVANLSPEQGMRLATMDAARAIGLGDEIGTLESGKWADLCFIRMDTNGPLTDEEVMKRVTSTQPDGIEGAWVAGRCRSGRPAGIESLSPEGRGT